MKRLGKQVQYFGVDLWITMPYVAVDVDGSLYEYEKEPILFNIEWISSSGIDYNRLGKVDLEGVDWKDTLLRFDI